MPDPITRQNDALAGRYRIERELGAGGMATVYLADDRRHERKVALKVLKPELAAIVGADRFLAEIRTTANLHHPHILPLHDSGEADGFLFYVMPYVEGESLRERLDREKQLPEPVWGPDGRELFYRNGADRLVSVSVRTSPGFAAQEQTILFPTRAYYSTPLRGAQYDVSPDGERFVMIRRPEGEDELGGDLVVIENLFEELKRLAPR